MIRIAVAGATGQTGQRVVNLAGREAGLEVVAALTAENDPWLRQSIGAGGRKLTIATDTDEKFDALPDFPPPEGPTTGSRPCSRRAAASG
ncbi:MAG: hypothetical protein GY778_09935, partial [bacterium]|nr:hypothetical protein [bacterium]